MDIPGMPSTDVEVLDPSTSAEKQETPVFKEEGEYTIIDGDKVEKGSYLMDTRVVKQIGEVDEWETQLKIRPEGLLVNTNSYKHSVYRDGGHVYRLYALEEDQKGEKSKEIHDKILEMVKKGTSPEEIDEQVAMLQWEM